MNTDQLRQLLGVIRVGGGGGYKTAKFSSAEGTEWRILRRNFEQTVRINVWANKRQHREAAAAMEATAAEFTSNIPAYVAGRAIADMLNLYEGRFLLAAAGQLAAAQFQTAAQMDGEQTPSGTPVCAPYSNALFSEKTSKDQDYSQTSLY
jgi:hypothetical protein